MFFQKFPYSNDHQLNLDWILKILKFLRGGKQGQVFAKKSDKDFDFGWFYDPDIPTPTPGTGSYFIHVIPDGTGDYTTISDAVLNASDGDTIIVHEGTYIESVKAKTKDVNIIGINRDKCILQYSGLDYDNPPLEMAKGMLANMTIKAVNSGTPGLYNAYCLHIDFDESQNKKLSIYNVNFNNAVHQAVGIGLRPHFTLEFRGCTFEALDQAAFYCHDFETANTSQDLTEQKVILRNCVMKNNSATKATVMMQSQELATDCANALFIGCSVYNGDNSGEKVSMTRWAGRTLTNTSWMGSSDWVLNYNSGLNTEEIINTLPLFPYRDNMKTVAVNSSNPLQIYCYNYRPVLLIGQFQGWSTGCVLVVSKNGGTVTITDLLTGNPWTDTHFVFSANASGIQMTTDYGIYSNILVLQSN